MTYTAKQKAIEEKDLHEVQAEVSNGGVRGERDLLQVNEMVFIRTKSFQYILVCEVKKSWGIIWAHVIISYLKSYIF